MARQRRHSFLLLLTVPAVVAAMLSAPTAQAADPPGSKGAGRGATARAAQASRALAAAQELFAPKANPRAAVLAHGRDATMALRDLHRLRDSLTGAKRAEADRLLARPTDGAADPDGNGYDPGTSPQSACNTTLCVHWIAANDPADVSGDGISAADDNSNGVPDYAELTGNTVQHVHDLYVAAGYKAPEPDQGLGGDDRIDIYLANIGPDGLYGYCNSDEDIPNNGPYDSWAYCVFDNDYSPGEFPTNTPTENLQVTAAHEYFHAVQFAYDYYEDRWFMEATATWAEDEVYDGVDDNVQYLSDGPLGRPQIALDKFETQGLHQYGDWIFFRYLTERFPTAQGGMPTLVREMWKRADGSATGPDQYSTQAVNTVLRARSTSFAAQFARFADANRRPTRTYDEGAANSYPKAPFGKFAKRNGWYVATLDHMTSATGRFTPSRTSKQLKIFVDLAGRATSPSAVVSVYRKNGSVQTSLIPLNTLGNGARTFPFARSTVAGVEVTLVNASARFSCWQPVFTPYSCNGTPRDENLSAKVRGRALS